MHIVHGLPSDIRADLGALLDTHLDSVAKLEVFVLLGRDERAWSPDALALELRSSPEGIDQILEELASRGLVERRKDGYVIAGALDIRAAARDLGQLYTTRRLSIINRIYQPTTKRPADPVRSFANAFRIKKDDDDA